MVGQAAKKAKGCAMKGGWIDPEGNFGSHSRQFLGHTWRYKMAAGFLEPTDIVLDLGCGVGYGTYILATNSAKVVGMDLDEQAIAIAKKRYKRDNVYFTVADAHQETLSFPAKYDVMCCFETLEHLEDPGLVAARMCNYAKRLMMVSVPVVPTVHQNPHHLHDFEQGEILGLLRQRDWELWEYVFQGPYIVVVMYNKEAHRGLRR